VSQVSNAGAAIGATGAIGASGAIGAIGAIGIFGGSFDPIHAGHLQLARDALRNLRLAEVRFVPAGQPWQKTGVTPAAARAQMVALALRGEPKMALDLRELARPGPSYTIDTLRSLRVELGPQVVLVLLIGADQLARLDTWHEWRSILDQAHLAVAARSGAGQTLPVAVRQMCDAHAVTLAQLHGRAAGGVIELPMTPIDCSASGLRALLREPAAGSDGQRARYLAQLVAPAVLDYIRANALYSNG
jgi:nicotinate-nucleotide adenylyltransferase